jgi:putative hemolysin
MNYMFMQIILQIILILLNAVFACAEIAVISMNDNKLASMAASGDKRAIRLARLTSQPARFLATIQVAITLSGFLGSAFAADNFSDGIVDLLVNIGIPLSVSTLNSIAVILITLLLSYFTLVFGELVPKRIAMKKAESLALAMSSLITFISHLFAPIVWLLTNSTNGILRLLGIDPNTEENNVSEEEIRMMVDAGSEKGVIDPEEKEMIQNVFEFDDLPVSEFATHRTDISLLWLEESIEEWTKTIHETRHSLYPICDETVDHVIGVLNAKDYFRLEPKTKENILENAVKPAYFVPETICADVLFRQMKKSRNHFAVVLDEYGGMVGIVTMNDLLEQLVGD